MKSARLAVVVGASHGKGLYRKLHSLDNAGRSGTVRLGEPVLNAIRLTDHGKAHRVVLIVFRFLCSSAN